MLFIIHNFTTLEITVIIRYESRCPLQTRRGHQCSCFHTSRLHWQCARCNTGCIQKFADSVDTLTTINNRWEATQMVIAVKITILNHKVVIKLHLVV